MRTLTVALAALLSLAFASRLSARPSIHVDSAAPSAPTLTGSTGGEDGGTKGDDDDEDVAIVHHA